MRTVRQRHRSRHACQLLDREHPGQQIRAGSPVLLRQGDAQDTKLPETLEQLSRKGIVLIDLRRHWRELAPRECQDRVAQDAVLVRQEVKDHPSGIRRAGRCGKRGFPVQCAGSARSIDDTSILPAMRLAECSDEELDHRLGSER